MRVLVAGFAAFCLMSMTAVAADWKTYVFRDQGFSIESLVPLAKGTGTYKAAVAGTIPTITYSGEADNIRYKVTVIDISNRLPDPVNIFEEMEFLTSQTGKVLENDAVGIEPGKGRHYGRQLVMQMKDGTLDRTALVYSKGKIYVVDAAVLPNGDKDSFAPERFVESILFDLSGAARARDADPGNFSGPDGK
jgi:hypothetical protein